MKFYQLFLVLLNLSLDNWSLIELANLFLFPKFIWSEQWLNSLSILLLFEISLHYSSSIVNVFVEVWHPYHHKFILGACCKIVSFFIEFNCFYLTLMSKHSPSKSSLFQVPNFNFSIIWYWGHMISMRMECQSVDWFIMGIIVLDKFS